MAEQQPQGTEYTLQGVMRFLQTEWHSHERARNAWDIERAELKAKIANQEGEVRNAKKKAESLDKHVRMLERAVKHERAKLKAAKTGSPRDDSAAETVDTNGTLNESKDLPNGALELDTKDRAPLLTVSEQETTQDKAKLFLQKSVEELTYILTPPGNPPPPEGEPPPLQNASFSGQQDARNEDHMARQQQARRNQQGPVSHFPSTTNHHPPPVRQPAEFANASSQMSNPAPQAPMMTRQTAQQPLPPTQAFPPPAEDLPSHMQHASLRNMDEPVESVSHSYDSYGRPIPAGAEDVDPSRPLITEDTDGWNFDDPSLPLDPTQPENAPRRPDTDLFPAPAAVPPRSPTRTAQNRRRSSGSGSLSRRRSDGAHEIRDLSSPGKGEPASFKVRFALRGHLDVVRSVIFTGGGSPSEPEICTTGDDGTVKRWIIPANYNNFGGSSQQAPHQTPDLDIQSYFTHRGHEGIVTCLAACPASATFSTGGRVTGDGWVFSGGQDATVRVWERGRVDPKATLEGHTDSVWALCVLPTATAAMFTQDSNLSSSGSERILLASGSSDQSIKIWAVSAPPQVSSPQTAPGGSRRGVGGSRRHSITSGSNFPSSPQPSIASNTPFNYTLVHSIEIPGGPAASPTCISPLGNLGENFVVSYSDSSVIIFDTRTGEEVVGMASGETYDGTSATGINSVVVTSSNASQGGGHSHGHSHLESGGTGMENEEESVVQGATGNSKDGGVEGVIITGHEDRYVRLFDANSGQCFYNMLAHPSAIACLSLSPDGCELVSAGHDASLRFWSLEKRNCIQEITSHRLMRGEGVVCVVWSADGRWVVSGGGDGVVKVFAR